jgi:hypothetical protein
MVGPDLESQACACSTLRPRAVASSRASAARFAAARTDEP